MIDDDTPIGTYVGVGISTYEESCWGPLSKAYPDAAEVGDQVRLRGLIGEPLEDPGAEHFRIGDTVMSLTEHNERVLLYWAGHGVITDQEFGLVVRDTAPEADGGGTVRPATLLQRLVRRGARQILFILDTCHATAALADLERMAAYILQSITWPDGPPWVGLFFAAQTYERAQDGLLASILVRLLDKGPKNPKSRLRWNTNTEGLLGTDLMDALHDEWPENGARPYMTTHGRAETLLRNPRYAPGPAEAAATALLWDAGRGAAPGESGFYFRGRSTVLGQLRDRVVLDDTAGVFVLTGPPGCGKSAVLGRFVALATPELRGKVPAADLGDDVAGALAATTVSLVLSARGLDPDLLLRAVVNRFVPSRAGDIDTVMQQLGQDWSVRPVIVIDALDEMQSGMLQQVVTDLLQPLSRRCLIIIGAREPHPALVELARSAAAVYGLTPEEPGTKADLRSYVDARLAGIELGDGAAVNAYIADEAHRYGGFLYARMATSRLRRHPVRTTDPHWRESVAVTVTEIFAEELAAADRSPGAELRPRGAARHLLTALAWSQGRGLPGRDIWPALAAAAAGVPPGTFTEAHVEWVLAALTGYVVESSELGHAVFRVFHSTFVRELRADEGAGERLALKVSDMLVEQSRQGREPELVHRHLDRYGVAYLAAGGPAAIDRIRRLAEVNPAHYRPLLADALRRCGAAMPGADHDEALPLLTEAADIWTDLAGTSPNVDLSDLGDTLDQVLRLHRQFGVVDEGDFTYEAVLSRLGPEQQAQLLIRRAGGKLPWGEQFTLVCRAWMLVQRESGADARAIRLATRIDRVLRHLHELNPDAFSRRWRAEKRPDLPWLADVTMRIRLHEWLSKPSAVASRDYARAHPELGTARAIEILGRLRGDHGPEVVDEFIAISTAIAAGGVEPTYRPIVAEEDLRTWTDLAPDWEASFAHLHRYGVELLDPMYDGLLSAMTGPGRAGAEVHRQLLVLHRHDDATGDRLVRLGYLMLGETEAAVRGRLRAEASAGLPAGVRAALDHLAGPGWPATGG